jgi:hypothetical protein
MTGQTTEASSGQATACNSNTSRAGNAQIALWFELLSPVWIAIFSKARCFDPTNAVNGNHSPNCKMMRRE